MTLEESNSEMGGRRSASLRTTSCQFLGQSMRSRHLLLFVRGDVLVMSLRRELSTGLVL